MALGGAGWLLAALVARIAGGDVPLPGAGGIAYAWIMLVGGAALGFGLAVLCRLAAVSGAARRARAAEQALRGELEKVADSHVVAPARAELDAYTTCRDALTIARG